MQMVLCLAVSMLLMGCVGGNRATETLSVARAQLPGLAVVFVAEAQGYFLDEGVEVRIEDFPLGRDCLDSVLRGENDIATVYTTPLMMKACSGTDLAVVATLHSSDRSTALVGRKSSGILSAADLPGKTVGLPKGTSGEAFLDVFLTANGLDETLITVVDVPLDRLMDTLAKGEIDAAVMWHPNLAEIVKQSPPDSLTIMRCDVYLEMSTLAGPRAVVVKKEEAITRFLRALARARSYLIHHPAEAHKIVDDAISGYDLSPESPVWADFEPQVELSHVLLNTLEQEAEWLRRQGRCSLPESGVRHLVAANCLRAADPENVTLPKGLSGPEPVDLARDINPESELQGDL